MKILLDTNVVSEAMTKQANPKVLRWLDTLNPDSTFISALTVGELERGIQRLPSSQRRRVLEAWLEEDILCGFSGRILPLDTEAMRLWGRLVAKLDAKGRILPVVDSQMAAQALLHHCRLATRNEVDFDGTGLDLLNPWNS